MKKLKRFLIYILTASIIFSNTIIPVSAETVSVSVVNNPKIDVVLTSKQTNVDLENFEVDVKTILQKKGVDVSNIEFTTAETKTVDTENNDAKKIFDNWTAFPFNKATNWYVSSDSVGSYITSSDNETYETGFFDTSNGYVNNLKLKSKVYTTEYQQPMGFIFRMTQQENDKNRYDYYCLSMFADIGKNYSIPNAGSVTKSPTGLSTYPSRRILVLYKVEGMVFDYNIWKYTTQKGHTDLDVQYKTLGTWGATPWYCMKYSGKYVLGSPSTNYRNAGGWRDGSPLQIGYTNTNMGDSKQKTTILGYSFQNLKNANGCDYFDIEIDVQNSNIDIKYDGNSIINVDDNSYSKGYYGVYQVTHVLPKFYNIQVSTESYKTFKEILTQPTWRENAKHIVVNVDDKIDDTLTGTDSIGEILSRTLADDIHFIQWGTDTNKSATEGFIAKNDNKGLFTYNNNYQKAVDDTAEYIKKLIAQTTESQYVIVGEDSNINVTPAELKNNAVSSDYPTGRWFIKHDKDYFPNSEGKSSLNCKFKLNKNLIHNNYQLA